MGRLPIHGETREFDRRTDEERRLPDGGFARDHQHCRSGRTVPVKSFSRWREYGGAPAHAAMRAKAIEKGAEVVIERYEKESPT